jgi:hypothetical protein
MRAIFSAVQLARDLHVPLRVVWERNLDLGARFGDLFDQPRGITLVERTDSFVSRTLSAFMGLRNDRHIYQLIRFSSYDLIFADFINSSGGLAPCIDCRYFTASSILKKRVLIDTCHAFYEYESDIACSLNPRRQIALEIKKVVSGWTGRVVGMHIRRSDHAAAITQAPTSLFVKSAQSILSEDACATIYMATDCEETRNIFASLFGNRVIIRKCERRRDTTRGMQDSLVDLYLLSSCAEIYGSPESSFSAMAAQLGKKCLKILSLP